MQEFEDTALEMMDRLKNKQQKDIDDLQSANHTTFFKKYRWSKRIVDLQKQEKIAFKQGDYEQAELIKRYRDQQEQEELDGLQSKLQVNVYKDEDKLKRRHEREVNALVKRITKDKNE